MKKLLFTGLVLSAVLQSQMRQQSKFRALTRPTATVNVVAYEAGGRYLGAPNIRIFMELDEQKDFAAEFHEGRAIQIPYGEYRVEAQQQGFFPDIKRVAVYQPFVTIVVGLRFASELPQIPPMLSGHIVGLRGATDRFFVKLVGIYENVSAESAISSDGSFTVGGLTPGLFALMIVGEKEVLITRTVTIPYVGAPLEIEIKGDVGKRSP